MYNFKRNNFLIPIFCICMLLMFSSCLSEQSINDDARGKTDQSTMVEVHANDDTRITQQLSSEIKTAYCGFTNEMNYGGESRFKPSDIYVIRYEGRIGNAEIVMMGGTRSTILLLKECLRLRDIIWYLEVVNQCTLIMTDISIQLKMHTKWAC